MLSRIAVGSLLVLTACSKQPPKDFAPDPTLVDRIAELRILPQVSWACPGETIRTEYEAVLHDGTRIPFSRSYDKNDPPALHVVFLDLWSPEAEGRGDGHWVAARDPLASAMEGFRLQASLRARPDIAGGVLVEPEYGCLPHEFAFHGRTGDDGDPGYPGPDVLLRLGAVSSPFYDRLLVLAIEVGDAPAFYVLQDAERIPPADWFHVASVGGRGGDGPKGDRGATGAPGRDGCPGEKGGTGGQGGQGGVGAVGGPGGPLTIIVDRDMPFLAGLIQGASLGGPGGDGGRGGDGGDGGSGGNGISVSGRACEDGPRGDRGPRGDKGPEGSVGAPGNPPRVLQVSSGDVFGPRVPPGLQSLVDFSR